MVRFSTCLTPSRLWARRTMSVCRNCGSKCPIRWMKQHERSWRRRNTPAAGHEGRSSRSGEQPCRCPMSAQNAHGLFVEGDKRLAAELGAFEGNDTVGEISAGIEVRKAGLRRQVVHRHVRARDQSTDSEGNVLPFYPIALGQHPAQ